MATNFKSIKTKQVGTVRVSCYTTPNSTKTTIIGMSIANLTESVVQVSMLISDGDSSTSTFYFKDVSIAPNSSIKPIGKGEKIVLEASDQLLIESSKTDSVDVITSLVEIV